MVFLSVGILTTILFLLQFGNETTAYLNYEEYDLPNHLLSNTVKNNGYHDLGTCRSKGTRYYYYSLSAFSPNDILIAKKKCKNEEVFTLLYNPETVDHPYALFKDDSAKICFDDVNSNNSMEFSVSKSQEILSLWEEFSASTPIKVDIMDRFSSVSLGNNSNVSVSLESNGFVFHLVNSNHIWYWCNYSYDNETCHLILYDESYYTRFVELYQMAFLEEDGGVA